jgi:hypothetical protein
MAEAGFQSATHNKYRVFRRILKGLSPLLRHVTSHRTAPHSSHTAGTCMLGTKKAYRYGLLACATVKIN